MLDPEHPRPVGNYIMTAQLLADVLLRALSALGSGRALAGSGGDGSLAIGWTVNGRTAVQYEILGSAYGASSSADGASGIDVHVANCRITPIEVLESEFPVQVTRFELIPDSGGPGTYRGGLGYLREYRVLAGEGWLSLKSDKHRAGGWGAAGGADGASGRVLLNPGTPKERTLPSRFSRCRLAEGDVVRFERPGGGGYGPPDERDPEARRNDLADGYVTNGTVDAPQIAT